MITGEQLREVRDIVFYFLLLSVFVGVFVDCRKQGVKVFSSIGWGFVGSIVFPPFGLIAYLIYRFKRWL